ncbi:MAG: hypothetical protein K8T91_04020 [Planctomycetes bacterium]|nr:hypothetical protein [Planctomycetota bacterium]
MEQLQKQPRGILPQVTVVALILFISASRAGAQSPALGEERPWHAPGALGVDPLTGEKESSLATDPQEVLAQWKTFQPTPLPTEEGAIVFLDTTAGARGTGGAVTPPPWKKWLLPGGLVLAGAVFLAGCLGAWRIMVRRRAAHVAEISSRFLPMPGSRK